jgi:hypothetical protein
MQKTKIAFVLLLATNVAAPLYPQSLYRPTIPKTWDETAMAEWATPVAGLNMRPTHISPKQYYSLSVENVRAYPVYFPGREPAGYWEMLQQIGPQPLIEPEKLKTEDDWIAAGRKVFDQSDLPHLRTFDPRLQALVRHREVFDRAHTEPLPDGTISDLRWVPTKQGVALSLPNCSGCHVLYSSNGIRIPGAPTDAEVSRTSQGKNFKSRMVPSIETELHRLTGAPPFIMGREPLGNWLYQAYGVPWKKNDINERLKSATLEEYKALIGAGIRAGAVTRWNGSLYYPAKIPDLIGFKDRKYIDHTATHLHRGIGDLMRYAALVSFAETADFGRYHVLAKGTKKTQSRLPDEALYALALYIYSIKPPTNPNPFDQNARAGQKIFAREGCPLCHTPPLYTSNKITLARGFQPPGGTQANINLLPLSVGTDPGLALETRKGTGYYKVPSLKGLWYRGHYLHDGSAASLEEMFDPERLLNSHNPGGWLPPGMKSRAIIGHEFGLTLNANDRKYLIAFLRTL